MTTTDHKATIQALITELEKLVAWTTHGTYIFSDSATQTELWDRLVDMGLVETLNTEHRKQYRVVKHS